MLGNNHLGNIFAEVITIKTLPWQNPRQLPTAEVNFESCLSDAEDNREGIADLPLLRTLDSSPKVPGAKFLGSDGLFCFSSICKFGNFKNSLATITKLSELYFRFRRFILLLKMKEAISMDYGSCTRSWKPWRWVRLDLILMIMDIYINSNLNLLTKFTSSSRSTEFRDILTWSISQMVTKTVPINTRIVISYVIKWGILLWIWWKINGNWDNNMIRISQWRESHCRANDSIRRRKWIQKSRTENHSLGSD